MAAFLGWRLGPHCQKCGGMPVGSVDGPAKSSIGPLSTPNITVTLQKKIVELHYITTFFWRVTLHYNFFLESYITLQKSNQSYRVTNGPRRAPGGPPEAYSLAKSVTKMQFNYPATSAFSAVDCQERPQHLRLPPMLCLTVHGFAWGGPPRRD